MNNIRRTIILFILFLGKIIIVAAQNLSVPEAVAMAWKQNQGLRITALELDAQKQLQKTSHEMPKTSIDLLLGRTQVFNSNDYTIGFNQQFNHPKFYRNVAILLNKQVEIIEQNEAIRKNELTFRIKEVFHKYDYYSHLAFLLKQQDSLFAIAQKAARLKYETGETNLLDKVLSETRTAENAERLRSIDNDKAQLLENFRLLINTKTYYKPYDGALVANVALNTNELNVNHNPLLALLNKQLELSKSQISVEKAKLLPDFRLGAMSQSIEHRSPQLVFQAGLGIPIFAKAYKARINAAGINEKIANEKLLLAQNELQSQLNVAIQSLQKTEKLIKFYQSFALPQGDIILKTAIRQYQQGEISYTDYIQASTQAWQIKENYINKLLELNLIINEIEYLSAKNL